MKSVLFFSQATGASGWPPSAHKTHRDALTLILALNHCGMTLTTTADSLFTRTPGILNYVTARLQAHWKGQGREAEGVRGWLSGKQKDQVKLYL